MSYTATLRHRSPSRRICTTAHSATRPYNEGGQPGHALKLFELAQIGLAEVRDDPRAPLLAAYLRAESACSFAQMGRTDLARSALAAAAEEHVHSVGRFSGQLASSWGSRRTSCCNATRWPRSQPPVDLLRAQREASASHIV
jgi:hypothetical protein